MYIVCGEVQAKVQYKESEKIYFNEKYKEDTGNEEKKLQIKINNFQINFYKTLSNFEIYDTMYAEQKLKIFSNFYLPISFIKITNKEQKVKEKIYSLEEAVNLGKEDLSNKIEEQIENKDNIIRKRYRDCSGR